MTTTNPPALQNGASPGKGLRIGLWIAQVLLALAFAGAGAVKLITPYAELVLQPQMGWAGDMPASLVKIIGATEVAGALGLLLPSLTRILPGLTPLAGAGLTVVMILAQALHLSRGEGVQPANLVLGALAAFVAWGRWKAAPIEPRG